MGWQDKKHRGSVSTETATGRLGAIPAIRQVLADLRVDWDLRGKGNQYHGKERIQVGTPCLSKRLGLGGYWLNCITE